VDAKTGASPLKLTGWVIMTRRGRLLASLLGAVVVSSGVNAQEVDENQQDEFSRELRDWVSYPIPAVDSLDRACAERSMKSWQVSVANERLVILPYDGLALDPLPLPIPLDLLGSTKASEYVSRRHRHVMRASDGWLVGLDAGEWGGALLWLSADGTGGRRLVNGLVRGLIDAQGKTLAVVGTLWSSETDGKGQVLHIRRNADGIWRAEPFAELPEFPMAVGVVGESVLILGLKTLFQVDTDGRVLALHQHTFGSLYPNSLLALGDRIYVGMRHFVVELTPVVSGYQEDWLVPTKCRHFHLIDNEQITDCVCDAVQ